ncbi:hypothetical protein ACHAW5_002873 [Stephanodiscus triporus]|uniref:Uncharacterized protein n=1 Tax=Stephanodiscus triporus TaxID=2934178 RepID=A0ABD3P7H9_9STRA
MSNSSATRCAPSRISTYSGHFPVRPEGHASLLCISVPARRDDASQFFIAITQFYAFVFVSLAGYRMIFHSGVRKLRLLGRLANMRVESRDKKKDEKTKTKTKTKKQKEESGDDENKAAAAAAAAAASRLVTESILDEADASSRSAFVGANVLAVGLAFFWLFANSFHVTSTTWIGGTAGLIHSLTVMELGLAVFMYYMYKDAGSSVRRSRRMTDFSARIARSRRLLDEDARGITVEEYGWLAGGWSPFWARGIPDPAESKLLTKEEEAVASNLMSFSTGIDDDVINGILARSRISLFEGFREYVYLLLNFFAFYGYLVCILVYYHPDEGSRPEYVRTMLFGMKNADADWLGNAVGDFMWTVEPIIILTSPMITDSLLLSKKKKEKLS